MITAVTNTTVDLLVNGRWVMEFVVLDDDCNVPASPTISVTSTNPSAEEATPTAELVSNGIYRVAVEVDEAGRWLTVVEASGLGSLAFSAHVSSVTENDAFPTLAQVKTYLGANSSSDAAIQDAMDAEFAAQRMACNVPAVYPADLAQALKRRVAVNLAKQGLPIMVLRGDAESGSLVPPGRDPEVRRLEGPHRKLVFPSWP